MKTFFGSKSFLIPLLVFVFASISLHAETLVSVPTTPGTGITIRLATPLTQMPHFGFLPVRATIENLSGSDGTWDLQFQLGNNGAAAPLTLTSRHNLSAPAGQTRETWLYLPVARAGFAANGGGAAPRASIVKTPTGTKISRVVLPAMSRGQPTSVVIDINETTGDLVTQNLSFTGAVMSTSTTRPPPGNSVIYTVDASGFVTTRYRPNVGAFRVDVITNPGARATRTMGTPPLAKIAVVPTPTGMKITRVFANLRSVTEEVDFDTVAGVVKTSRIMADGSAFVTNSKSLSTTPGSETIYTINPTDGTYSTQNRQVSGSSAPAKMTVTVSSTSAASPVGAPIAPLPTGNPIATTVVAEISGPGISGLARVAFPNNLAGNPMRPFAVSAALESDFRAALASQVTGAPNLAAVTLAQLPADWRIWSSFSGVILAADDYAALDAARRGALRGWVGLGGQLFLVPANPGDERIEKVGAGRVVTLGSPVGGAMGPALGTVLNLYGETVALPDRESLFLKNTSLGEAIKVEDGDSSWIAIFLVLFAAVIGPVNLFVFAPASRRHRLFWTTPALALLGGVVLSATIFFQDGVGGNGSRTALVVLLPGLNQAAVFQEQSGRTGFLTRRAFALDDDVLLAPLAVEAEASRAGMFTAINVTRDAGQAGGDWFRSRAAQSHLLRRLAPTRGRVELAGTAPDGAPIVESSLATVLREFVLRDATGKFWRSKEITPGRRITLDAAKEVVSLDRAPLGGSAALAAAYSAAASPVAGRWAAYGGETDVAPFPTLSSMRWSETRIAYTGIAESPTNAPTKGGIR